MKQITLHPLPLPHVTFPHWGWRLFVVVVAVIGCLPAVIVRLQIQATLDAFDANRLPAVRQVRNTLAVATQRGRGKQIEARERESVVLH